ncbi:MAG: metal-dependent hydrolase [Alphaproteobacteria bacterium]|nr:metal-dependent hydrolase [Alphaproteobacteria bacterium]
MKPTAAEMHSRNFTLPKGAPSERWWVRGDPVATAFFNALSATFPQGERFFIESVKHYRDQVSPELKRQIAVFAQQESLHTREHVIFNRLITEAGYDAQLIDQRTKERFDMGRDIARPIDHLAVTAALEHFTAIMAHSALAHDDDLDGVREDLKKLWRWHAIEEIEHKSVAFDTMMEVTAGIGGFRRWLLRSAHMLISTIQFLDMLFRTMAFFFRTDGINSFGTWMKVMKFLFVSPGMFRRIAPAYFAYYLPGFHPWKIDDRALAMDAEKELGFEYAAA